MQGTWKRTQIGAMAVVLGVVMLAAACGSSNDSGSGGGSTGASTGTTGTSGSSGGRSGYGSGTSGSTGTTGSQGGAGTDVSGMSTFTVKQEDFQFSPSTLTGTAGEKLTIHVENDGNATHTFTIDSEHVNVELQPGQSKDVKVSFPKTGSVEFYCQFHKSMGMTGQLTVA